MYLAESHKPQKTKVVRTYPLFLIKFKEGLRWCFWAFTMKESKKKNHTHTHKNLLEKNAKLLKPRQYFIAISSETTFLSALCVIRSLSYLV